MAVVIEPLASFMVENLCNFLIEEGRSLGAVIEQVDEMQKELKWMQRFLVDADQKRRLGDDSISEWFVEIRELAYYAEEVIATFVVKVAGRRRSEPGCLDFKGWFRFAKTIPNRHMVGRQIQDINKNITRLTERLQAYKVESTSAATKPRITYSTGVDETVVGLDGHVMKVVEHLKDKTHARVISICGMGGLGKTTFSKEILRHREIKTYFEHVAWVCISQQCNPSQVWRDTLLQFAQSDGDKSRIRQLTPPEMASELESLQMEKKCLVILDDIWEQQDWKKLRPAFPPRAIATGSKILLMTRNQAVVSHDHDIRCIAYNLPLLEKEQCLEILERKLSRDRQEFSVTPEQKKVLEEIVKRCGGLPLAIVLVGGILAEDSSLEGCKKVLQDLINSLNEPDGQNDGVWDVLALSYLYLPYHLKACFLYLSLFPEDHDIDANSLVQMWIAEGFVSTAAVGESGTKTSLDVGLSYLKELVNRCIVQADIAKFSRRIRSCRLHDLMREFCRKKAIEENFFAEFGLQQSTPCSTSSPNTIRRLAVNLKQVTTIPDGQRYQHARSCSVYRGIDDKAIDPWDKINSLFKGFKFLKVFHVIHFSYERSEGEVSEDIGKLIHLRYLRVGILYKGLPTCLGNLILLQTLDLKWISYGSDIPDVLWKLKELRHLYLPEYEEGFTYRLRLDGLSKLETLDGFDTSRSEVGDLATLPNIRKIHITCKIKDLAKILDSPMFREPNSLLRRSNFYIEGDTQTQEEHNTLCRVSSSPSIAKLRLEGHVYEETFLHSLNAKITLLALYGCGLKEDPMPALQRMPNLKSLVLGQGSYIGKKLECLTPKKTSSSGSGTEVSFPQLTSLWLWGLEISEWKVEQGALPCLSELTILNCKELNEIPDGLRFISTLEAMLIRNPNETLKRRLEQGGEDFPKIQHVPDFRIHNY